MIFIDADGAAIEVDAPLGRTVMEIAHANNIVEHPELICERIIRFANIVGRENVIAGTDCGFSTQATYTPEVHPTVVGQISGPGGRCATGDGAALVRS